MESNVAHAHFGHDSTAASTRPSYLQQNGISSATFASRRPAANGLPPFTLPVPDVTSRLKSPLSPLSPGTSTRQVSSSYQPALGILTPSSGNSSDSMSPVPTGSAGAGSGSNSGSAGVNMNYSSGQWPTPGAQNPAYTYGPHGFAAGGRSVTYATRGERSPGLVEGLPPPSGYSSEMGAFAQGMAGGGHGSGSAAGSGVSPALSQPSYQQHPHPLPTPILGSHQSSAAGSAPSQPSPRPGLSAGEAFSRAQAGSTYYSNSTTPQQATFPSYAPQPSPTQQPSPSTTLGGPVGSVPALSSHHPSSTMQPPQPYGAAQAQAQAQAAASSLRFSSQAGGASGPGPGTLSGLSGPVYSNIGNPHGRMAIMHLPVPVPYAAPPQYPMYTQQAPAMERPFKCDTCPQSFNRNHDLKRHKRIHLSVKPYPCAHCDKAFSRKDALKRHRMVKGCENKADAEKNAASEMTPPGTARSGATADASNGSPNLTLRAEQAVTTSA